MFPTSRARLGPIVLITICAGVIVGDSLIGAGDAFWKMFAG